MWARNRERMKKLELQVMCLKGMIQVKEDQITRAETIINRLLDEKKKAKEI